jgi:hypothetical protein
MQVQKKKVKLLAGRKKGINTYKPAPSKKEVKTIASNSLFDSIIFEEDILLIFGIRDVDLRKLRYFRKFPHTTVIMGYRIYTFESVYKWILDNEVILGFDLPEEGGKLN